MPFRVVDLSKRIGNKWVLRDISIEVSEGRVFGICGGTASGKSVLIDCLAGDIKINGGSVRTTDLDGTDISPAAPSVVRGIEKPALTKLLTGGSKESTGEQRLRSFRSALSRSSGVLLLDEPFSGLDSQTKKECFSALREAAISRQLMVIFASSDFDQIVSVADEMAVLSRGSILQSGTPQEIFESPENVETALLSGEHNLFVARRLTSSDADMPEFMTIDGGHRVFAQQPFKKRLGSINQNVTLAIRPEQIVMSMGASFPEDNLMKAVVTGIRFQGSTSLIDFDAEGLRLSARVFQVVGLQAGDECMLGLPPHRISVLTG